MKPTNSTWRSVVYGKIPSGVKENIAIQVEYTDGRRYIGDDFAHTDLWCKDQRSSSVDIVRWRFMK